MDAGVIQFDNVPVVTPNKDVLLRSLSFRIDKGMNLMIVGPNGCGKSSLFRLLGELWPLFGGTIIKAYSSPFLFLSLSLSLSQSVGDADLFTCTPSALQPNRRHIFYVPQRPYLALGSLRDQIIYPHSVEDMPKTMTDKDLRLLLQDVRLE